MKDPIDLLMWALGGAGAGITILLGHFHMRLTKVDSARVAGDEKLTEAIAEQRVAVAQLPKPAAIGEVETRIRADISGLRNEITELRQMLMHLGPRQMERHS